MKKKRLSFAKRHADWAVDDWKRVLFSDETTLQQFVSRKKFVRRPSGKRFDERYTQQSMKHPPSVMIWGAMSWKGNAGLFFLPKGTTMNGDRYLDLLKEKLQLHMEVHECSIFMQDGASCHRSRIVSDFLRREGVRTLEWPGNSPDLNPIENLWTALKDKVADLQPSSANELEKAIKLIWTQHLSKEYCTSLVSSMPSRIAAVINARGGHTKY